MALSFNGVIPQTRALGTSRRLSSPYHKPSHTQIPTWLSLQKKRLAQSTVSSFAAKTDSTLSDVEYQQLQDHSNGFSPTPTSTSGKIYSNPTSTIKAFSFLVLFVSQ